VIVRVVGKCRIVFVGMCHFGIQRFFQVFTKKPFFRGLCLKSQMKVSVAVPAPCSPCKYHEGVPSPTTCAPNTSRCEMGLHATCALNFVDGVLAPLLFMLSCLTPHGVLRSRNFFVHCLKILKGGGNAQRTVSSHFALLYKRSLSFNSQQ